MAQEKKIGKISHYFSKLSVGIIDLASDLKVGDTIKIKGHTTDFDQKVESMQLEHKAIQEAKKGDSVGLKVADKVREDDEVYKVVE
jgi:putative protease